MATQTAGAKSTTKKSSAKKEAEPKEDIEGTVTDEREAQEAAAQEAAAAALAKQDEAMEILEPKGEPKQWLIGKPPQAGGTDDEYSIYVQKPLAYMARLRFYALVSKAIANAIKSGGTIDLDLGEGSLGDRIKHIRQQDFSDASSFMTLAFQLITYSPDFLLECYCMWLEVPAKEKTWAKLVMEQDADPEHNKWGLSEDDGMEMIEIFIDQNQEAIRSFFVEKLPRMVTRVQKNEKARQQLLESTSGQSKQ